MRARSATTLILLVLAQGAASACADDVDCDQLCLRTLACEVTFAPVDDITGEKIASGERTEASSCALGCAANSAVTADSARCVEDVAALDTNPATCQAPVLACFGVDLANADEGAESIEG